jgi:hypothetical protein
MPSAMPDTVIVISFLPRSSDVTGKHPVQSAVALGGVAFGKTIIGRDVERERVVLLQVLVEERL